jgi:uncharacterized lipoprotein YddW (UPF0748 family)
MQINRATPLSRRPAITGEPFPCGATLKPESKPLGESRATDSVDLSRTTPDLVDVTHKREMRGAWIASVWNINFPSSSKLTADQQKAELNTMLDKLQEAGFNSVFFQVRPEGDALYQSELEPWSNSLTGTQGKDPGYDPLAYLVEEAHERNLEVHAWLNPYRAKAASPKQVAPHLAVLHPEHVHDYGNVKWMDPGAEVVQERLVKVCEDLAERYDIDGIHFDDYFYPYPNGKEFPDDSTWREYQREGGKLSRADWRRENVNEAVKSVEEALDAKKGYVRFGISPFGLPAPDRPEGTWGFDQYEGLYADTQKWMDEGWVDYLAPQLYWPTDKRGQEYEKLVKWWNDHSGDNCAIFAGNNVQALGTKSSWTVDEFRKQVRLSREHAGPAGAGNLWWHVGPVLENKAGIRDVFKNELYKEPALTPVLPEAPKTAMTAPLVVQTAEGITLKHQDEAPLRAFTVYQLEDNDWHLKQVVPGKTEIIQLPAGTWAVAAASKHGVESQGVVVQVG